MSYNWSCVLSCVLAFDPLLSLISGIVNKNNYHAFAPYLLILFSLLWHIPDVSTIFPLSSNTIHDWSCKSMNQAHGTIGRNTIKQAGLWRNAQKMSTEGLKEVKRLVYMLLIRVLWFKRLMALARLMPPPLILLGQEQAQPKCQPAMQQIALQGMNKQVTQFNGSVL